MRKIMLAFTMLIAGFAVLYAADKTEYSCGIALGYPPYQFVGVKGETVGIDYEVTKAVFEGAGLKVKFVQESWDDVMFGLVHNTGKVDLLCGAEINEERKKWLDFSDSYYSRNIVIFTLKNSKIEKISDLYGQIIAGDRHSFVERGLGEDKNKIRIMSTDSKEESFTKLKEGKVVAVVAPVEVGNYITKNMGLAVKILGEKDPGSPVAFAVAKGDTALLVKINGSLSKLIKDGTIDKIMKKYK